MRITIFVFIALLIAAQPVFAHPPTKIEISFDRQTRIVTATITHPVENPATHYIGKVDVALNGAEIIEQQISRQDNADTQSVSYRVADANPGDTISVEGYCNISGEKEEAIKVE
jgi:desulfoferrodoxin (superoxide reductase-like protein)